MAQVTPGNDYDCKNEMILGCFGISNKHLDQFGAMTSNGAIAWWNGAMASWLRRWIPNPGAPCSKPLGGSKVDSAFHLSEVDKMSTRNFWELSGKK